MVLKLLIVSYLFFFCLGIDIVIKEHAQSHQVLGNNTFNIAQQVGSSPDSGATPKITTVYDAFEAAGNGSTAAGTWGDYGTNWNRLYSASTFSPNGDLSVEVVPVGKTFYSGTDSRVQKVGTETLYSNQQFSSRDDYGGYNVGAGAEDYQLEESQWISISGNDVWKDQRTNLLWTKRLPPYFPESTNDFNISTCDYFSSSPRSAYNGLDATCGSVINYCALLDLAGRTDWYLPTQKELYQGAIDGIFNQALNIASMYSHWSSTETSSDPTYAKAGYTHVLNISSAAKIAEFSYNCVARD